MSGVLTIYPQLKRQFHKTPVSLLFMSHSRSARLGPSGLRAVGGSRSRTRGSICDRPVGFYQLRLAAEFVHVAKSQLELVGNIGERRVEPPGFKGPNGTPCGTHLVADRSTVGFASSYCPIMGRPYSDPYWPYESNKPAQICATNRPVSIWA